MSGESAEFLFVVRLHEDGAPWVALQPKHKGLATLQGEIGLNLYRGTSLEGSEATRALPEQQHQGFELLKLQARVIQ